jgi:hypothetical protein
VRLAHFAREFETNVSAQREADKKNGMQASRRAGLFEKRKQIRREAGVVKGPAKIFGASTGAHMEAVRHKSRFERVPRHAAHVPGVAAAFEPVQQNYLACQISGGALGLDQHLRLMVGTNQPVLHRVARTIVTARPVVAEDGQQVRIGKNRLEAPWRSQTTFSQNRK